MHAPHQVAQFDQGLLGFVVRLIHEGTRTGGVGRKLGLGAPQLHGDRHQALLVPVVQVPLDLAPLRFGRIHQAGAAALQFPHPGDEAWAATLAQQRPCDPRVGLRHGKHHMGRGKQQREPAKHRPAGGARCRRVG